MKEVKFSQNSWHWRLANTYGNAKTRYDYETETDKYEGDICSYTRSVMWGALAALLLTAGLGLIAASIADFGAWVVVGFLVGTWVKIDVLGFLIIAATFAVVVVAAMIYVATKHEKWKRKRWERKHERAMVEEEKPEGFVKAAYRKFKDKTCFRVEVT